MSERPLDLEQLHSPQLEEIAAAVIRGDVVVIKQADLPVVVILSHEEYQVMKEVMAERILRRRYLALGYTSDWPGRK